MRVGINPQKKDYKLQLLSNHRVVMVVFIPELTGYYLSMLEVIKTSIKSLIITLPETSKITIVDNGSCSEVQDYLIALLKNEKIDSLKLFKENIGKIDALVGVARGCREPIITLADCDILFKPDWVYETIKVFNAFKNVSSVSPIPTRKGLNYYTYSTKLAILKKNISLNFEIIKENFKEFNLFLKSINWQKELNENKLWPVVTSKNIKAIVGSDHQVLTLRRDVLFNNSPKEPSLIKVGSESEQNYIDNAIDTSLGLRLSTYNYFAYHMGNTLENWMIEKIKQYEKTTIKLNELTLEPSLKYLSKNNLGYKIKKKIIKKFFKIKTPLNY